MKKIISIILIVLLVVAGGVLLKKRKAHLAAATPAPVLPAVVTAMDLKTQPVTLTFPAMGVVESDVSTVLSTRISGQVISVLKREGEPVQRGDLLIRIDDADLQAKRKGLQAKIDGLDAEIEAKRQAHQRTLELLEVKGASLEQKQMEEAYIERLVRERESLMQSMREIDSLMAYAKLVAPIDGTVSQILARPGDLATPGKPLIKIASRSGLYLNFSMPHSWHAASVLLQGHELPLTSKEQTGETGLVQYVAPLPENAGLIEGQYVNVDVVTFKGEDVLVPIDALLTMDGSTSVFVLSADGKAQRLNVTIKARGIEGVTIEQNLSGKRVIVAKPDILLRVAAGVPVITSHL